jgi:hypothetical protein
MRATAARVALGSATVTGSPVALFTVTEYLGPPVGVLANRDGMVMGFKGGASTESTGELSAPINISSLD